MNWVVLLIGVLAGIAVSDLYLAVTLYLLFPQQKVKPWPLAGFWMSRKCMKLLKFVRYRMTQLHTMAALFPMKSSHNDTTREFVAAVYNGSAMKASEVQNGVDTRGGAVLSKPESEAQNG